MMRYPACFPFVLFVVAIGTRTAESIDFFVATTGSDRENGTQQQPFATVEAAQAAVRAARIEHPEEPVTVTIAPGHYELEKTWVLTAQDSGASVGNPVCYRAAPGGEVILSGGMRISNWQSEAGNPLIWKTRVFDGTNANQAAGRFEQLWVNGRRAIRARTPNDWDFHTLRGVKETAIEGRPDRFEHTFYVAPGDLESLSKLSKDEIRDGQVVVYHKWDTTREWLQAVDEKSKQFVTTGGIMKHWNPLTRDCLYYFENNRGALDSPGEWFVDRDGWLFYYSRDDEQIESAEVIAPRLERLVDVQGSIDDATRRVRHVKFEGLKFRHAEYRIPAEGLPPWQAAMNVDATAVHLDGAEEVRFSDCAVEHVGTTGFWFRKACRNCRVERTRIFDLGIAGVRIGEEKLVPESVRTGAITIDNCIVHSGGRIMSSAVGIWIGHSADNAITHCDVADFFYTAVSVGWRWGYDESGAKRNKIEFNHLHHLGYRILSDMGGVYTLGPSEGTSVSHNVIHDVYSTRYGGWGLYPDEGSSHIVYENNLVYDVRDGCFHQHYGRENIVRNNIFAFSEEGQIAVTRPEPHQSFSLERNLVYFDEGTLLGYSGWRGDVKVQMNHNLYWRANGQPIDFVGKSFAEWQASGRDQDSIIADPLFVDPSRRDFRFRDESPAKKLGFVPFDYSNAGVYGSEGWKQLAASTKYPLPYVVPKPEPLSFEDDFETASGLSLLGFSTLNHEGREELIRIADSPDGLGSCLRVQDAPDLVATYNPHLYFDPLFDSGQATLSFRIYLSSDADVTCEWRSKESPYKVGPRLRFFNEAVWLDGRQLTDLPASHWCRVTMVASVEGRDRVWMLRLVLPDGSEHIERDVKCDPNWNEARWIGFTSAAKNASVWFLDDVKMAVEKGLTGGLR